MNLTQRPMYKLLIYSLSIFVMLYGNVMILLRPDLFMPTLGRCDIISTNSYVFEQNHTTIIFDIKYTFENISYVGQMNVPCHVNDFTKCENLYVGQSVSCQANNCFTNDVSRFDLYTPNKWNMSHYLICAVSFLQLGCLVISDRLDEQMELAEQETRMKQT